MSLVNAEVWPGRACTGHWTAGTACTSLSSKSSLVQLVKSQPFLQLELEQKLQGDDDHDPAADSVGTCLLLVLCTTSNQTAPGKLTVTISPYCWDPFFAHITSLLMEVATLLLVSFRLLLSC